MLFITEFEIEGDVLDVEPACLDFGEIKNVVDNGKQRRTGVVDLADVIPLFGSQIGPQAQMRETNDRVHRRTDLVAHVGEELGLRLGGILGGNLGFRQGCLDPFQFSDVHYPTEHTLSSFIFHVHHSGEGVVYLAIRSTKLNAGVPNNSFAIELVQQRFPVFGVDIEVWYGRPHSKGKHLLHSWIGEASDVVSRYCHPYR